ncbi:MAG: hypothetical protein ACYTKD_12400 [Planctomycetota bacterium]|jgi:hypothetical protein
MATLIDATCSECFLPQVIELNPRRMEIACEFCSHSVPMFEKRDMDGIRSVLRQEASKTYIALAVFGAAAALFAAHVWFNSKDDVLQVTTSDGVPYAGYLETREETQVLLIDEETDEPITVDFKEDLEDKVAAKLEKFPMMPKDTAAAMVGDENSEVLVQEQGQPIWLILAGVAALVALVFSAIATQDRLVCEF